MGPVDPRRAFEDDMRQVLGDGVARGDRLIEAIAGMGSRHPLDPFRSLLSMIVPLERGEPEARETVVAIERHRATIEARLGRDPGFIVAACDLLHDLDRTLRDPVFRDYGPRGAMSRGVFDAGTPLEEILDFEGRRAERSGRSLAVIVLAPGQTGGLTAEARETALAALRDGARDIDTAAAGPADDLILLLPCTGGREALRAADRHRRSLLRVTGIAFIAGVAAAAGRAAEARGLRRMAGLALQQARSAGSGVVLHRTERRDHARIPVGDAVPARLRSGGVESEIVLEDLSLGGALLSTQHRIDPGGDVVLAVRGPLTRPPAFLIPSRVLRVEDGPMPGRAPWRAALGFGRDARLRVAALLADLRGPDRGAS